MNRLTSNKDISAMGMFELVHNSCYVCDGKARYRDYDSDVDARKLAIQLLERYADVPNEFTCDDDFDEYMIDSLQYGTDCIDGVIAVFYRNMWGMADLYERLKRYEDTELTPEKILKMDKIYQELSKEVMQYREIGTIKECQEAMERQRAKKPNLFMNEKSGMFADYAKGHGEYNVQMNNWWRCPCCNEVVGQRVIAHKHIHDQRKKKYCENCGQAIDWNE